jgi:TfoX/Sxy family transcriptional regulator of competence genes
MAYNEILAQRVRESLRPRSTVVEKKMFGGIAFMVNGNMALCVTGDDLVVRAGLAQFEAALEMRGVGLFQPTGKPMTGWVKVAPDGHQTEESLERWIEMALEFVQTLPGK